jgi:ketosteroid isomerase-like protein
MQDLDDPFEQTVIEPEEFFARGDRVVAFIRIRRRPSGSTAEVKIRIGELWTLRDGRSFGDRRSASAPRPWKRPDCRSRTLSA